MRHLASILHFCCQPVTNKGTRYQKLSDDNEDGRQSLPYSDDDTLCEACCTTLTVLAVVIFILVGSVSVAASIFYVSYQPSPVPTRL